MKRFILLTVMLCITIATFCQVDTTFNFQNISEIFNTASGQTLSWKVMFFCAILGFIGHSLYDARKGVKKVTNGSPLVFMWSYWVKDNALAKITTLIGIITTSNFFKGAFSLLPSGWLGLVVLGVLSIIIGITLDYITQFLNMDPKIKVNEKPS